VHCNSPAVHCGSISAIQIDNKALPIPQSNLGMCPRDLGIFPDRDLIRPVSADRLDFSDQFKMNAVNALE
jgi:hypothetical protein